jgi:hypothetical protein
MWKNGLGSRRSAAAAAVRAKAKRLDLFCHQTLVRLEDAAADPDHLKARSSNKSHFVFSVFD